MFGAVFTASQRKLSVCIALSIVAVTAFCALFLILNLTKYATSIQCIVHEKCVEESIKQGALPTIKKRKSPK